MERGPREDLELELSADTGAAAWIAPRLTGGFGAVTRTVPDGFPAYARIFHPAPGPNGGWVRWEEVARTTGAHVHAVMQWHALVGAQDWLNMTDSQWPGGNPERGNLGVELLNNLCQLLAQHTNTPEHCYFCIWEGYGWLGSDKLTAANPRVHLPWRDYILLIGSLAKVTSSCWYTAHRQSPNLFWSADWLWCVASEIDFDSTLVAGSASLIEAIVESRLFEAWRVGPDDSLAADADRVNGRR